MASYTTGTQADTLHGKSSHAQAHTYVRNQPKSPSKPLGQPTVTPISTFRQPGFANFWGPHLVQPLRHEVEADLKV
eukprot:1142410-Pelagomonas_calceolata.AAC.5